MEQIVDLIKSRLGITSNVRDSYITAIANGVKSELEDEKGLVIDLTNPNIMMFIVDYATWRYQNKDSNEAMPRHLQFRLHNLIIHVGSNNLIVNNIETVEVLPITLDSNTVYILNDGTKQMYIDEVWKVVEYVNGIWVVATV